MSRRRLALAAAGLGAACALPYQLSAYPMQVADVAIVFALLAIGLHLTLGVAGQINLAQVAFFGVSAYTTAILVTHGGFGFWPAATLGVLAALAAGLIAGVPALRVQSHYLGIVGLGLAIAFLDLVSNAAITGGSDGLSGIAPPPFFGLDLSSDYLYYYLEVLILVPGIAFAAFIASTRLGRRMRAMRDDHLAAAAIGAEVPYLRMIAFALGGLYGGLAGVLYAGLLGFVAPPSASLATMFLVLAMVMVGGRFSLTGSIIGAVVLTAAREALLNAAAYAQLGYGLVVVATVILAPEGLAGLPGKLAGRPGSLAPRRKRPRGTGTGGLAPYLRHRAAGRPAQPGTAVALEAGGITRRFTGVTALDDVSLTVGAGEIYGIVGPNGSGKTTLFNVISGLYRPDAGRIRIFGTDTTRARPYQISRLGVARTFQNLRLFHRLTTRDNILAACDRTRVGWAWRYLLWPAGVIRGEAAMRSRAADLLGRYGLAALTGVMPSSLPYGTQRRIEIARAMATGPRLLLLDEPAAGLNPSEIGELADIVRDIRDSGVTVVLIEHNMGLVMSLCDHVIVFDAGRVIAQGTPQTVTRDAAVIAAYLGDASLFDAPAEVTDHDARP
jgi:branched-chain amino acid transport system ATP-binding protein/branched-chain amino acid transport system permease protein